jgi:putative ABC transport system permease protein
MFTSYFKIAWRHLRQNKGLSFINIFGLATGMAFAIVIGLWIKYETSFDEFNLNRERIGLVLKHNVYNGEKSTMDAVPLALYYELKANYPEVKRVSRMDWADEYSLAVGDKKFRKIGRHVDNDFLGMFTFPVIKGNPNNALTDLHSVVISESLANTLFGNKNPIGQTIRVNNEYNVNVSAVVKDAPKNSTIQFDFLRPYQFQIENNEFIKQNVSNWQNNFLETVVELKEGVSMESFSKKIANLNVEKDKTIKDIIMFLHPMNRWHLKNDYKNWVNVGTKYNYVKLFGMVAIFVLLIACINFMNLATARSEKRAREVGIRKAIGSLRRQLITQFMTETLLTSLIAFILALVMIPLLLPFLKDLGFENISLDLTNLPLFFSVLGVALVTGLIAGSYPALYLSSFLPVKVLKGVFKQGYGAVTFRRILVVSQFAISIGLIISTVIVFQQIQHAKGRSIGYNPDNLVRVNGSKDLVNNFVALKHDLLATGYIESVTKTSGPLTNIYNSWSDFSWEGKDPNKEVVIDAIMTEWDYEKTVGLKFKKGRPFSNNYKTDSNAVILNEAALNVIGYKDPIGKTMKSAGRSVTIVGVVEDMLIQSPFKPVQPLAILFNAKEATNFIFLRLKPRAPINKAIAAIQPVFEKYNPSYPFDIGFSDKDFENKFKLENQVGKLAGIFAALAIFISCLGLFGLAVFMAERRTKEIGIRKVLGATIINLWTLLSREFIWLVLTGCFIASPVAFWLMQDWLQSYDYRINISWWIFVVAAVVAILIALITVSSQAIKAAVANPVKSLRSE